MVNNPDILEKEPISLFELSEELNKAKKRDGELSFRGQKVEEYLQQVMILKPKQAKELSKELNELDLARLKPEVVKKLIDILPVNEEEVKNVLSGADVTMTSADVKKIADIMEKYKSEK
ncbi:MAG: hypothetical protein H6502_04350 [Candidatus Woesearchaeota archaeon]|nr:MAG: hypothetical protein H6502_04350 [Candidatus Woesearchaeota archaeon]